MVLSAGVIAAACVQVTCSRLWPGRPPSSAAQGEPAAKRLAAFASDADLSAYLRELAQARARQQKKQLDELKALGYTGTLSTAETVSVAAVAITNVQHAGVDEGDIVKTCGDDFLLVLRRGRLFSVRIGEGSLRPVSAVDAFGPEIDPDSSWYDEMLVSGRTVVVIGYSYERGGTELGLFDVMQDGAIRYRATYHLRSDDYYSSRNYASRLLGKTLVLYAPLSLAPEEGSLLRGLPALRKWHQGATADEFHAIYSSRRIYRPLVETDDPTLHSVITCDLGGEELTCRAGGVIGPPDRVFYVSPNAVYVWAADWSSDGKPAPALLYRMPLDGAQPAVVSVSGSPVDQFSFLEEGGHLNVILRAEARGDGMWKAEIAEGDVAFLRLPLSTFSTRVEEVSRERYRPLPHPGGDVFQNRFVGRYALYGAGNGWGEPDDVHGDHRLFAYRYDGGAEPATLALGHAVDRIEALGDNAIVVGADAANLHFTTVGLRDHPAVADTYTRVDASQGETRSHSFFYKPDDSDGGILGLPIAGRGRPGYEHLFEESASLVFLRNAKLHLEELGELTPQPEKATDDGCRASCVDWYGNARPIFIGHRTFALLGYELVEGRVSGGRVEEIQRVNFAPARAP
jgi:hypothetical protein